MKRTVSSTVYPLHFEPSGNSGFHQLAGNVLIKYQGSCLKNCFSLPLSELVLVLSQRMKNQWWVSCAHKTHCFKSKMYLQIMQGSGLWKIVVSRLVYSSFCFLYKVYLMLFADAVSGQRGSGTRCLPASVCLGFEMSYMNPSNSGVYFHQIDY